VKVAGIIPSRNGVQDRFGLSLLYHQHFRVGVGMVANVVIQIRRFILLEKIYRSTGRRHLQGLQH